MYMMRNKEYQDRERKRGGDIDGITRDRERGKEIELREKELTLFKIFF